MKSILLKKTKENKRDSSIIFVFFRLSLFLGAIQILRGTLLVYFRPPPPRCDFDFPKKLAFFLQKRGPKYKKMAQNFGKMSRVTLTNPLPPSCGIC